VDKGRAGFSGRDAAAAGALPHEDGRLATQISLPNYLSSSKRHDRKSLALSARQRATLFRHNH
jgi:hypothetical protein